MATVSQLLAALPAHFEGVAPSVAAAAQASDLATQLYGAAIAQAQARSTLQGRDATRLGQ